MSRLERQFHGKNYYKTCIDNLVLGFLVIIPFGPSGSLFDDCGELTKSVKSWLIPISQPALHKNEFEMFCFLTHAAQPFFL